ncbi:MAG: sigma-70 family RNA polymerase sigma factor [Clostridiales bacterium]|nr:sigma-70 family RNA polymerase sigma factor [Clostridiales bacterium]
MDKKKDYKKDIKYADKICKAIQRICDTTKELVNKDQKLFEEFYKKFQKRIGDFAKNRLKSSNGDPDYADGIISDFWYDMIKKKSICDYDGDSKLTSYLFSIVKNKVSKYFDEVKKLDKYHVQNRPLDHDEEKGFTKMSEDELISNRYSQQGKGIRVKKSKFESEENKIAAVTMKRVNRDNFQQIPQNPEEIFIHILDQSSQKKRKSACKEIMDIAMEELKKESFRDHDYIYMRIYERLKYKEMAVKLLDKKSPTKEEITTMVNRIKKQYKRCNKGSLARLTIIAGRIFSDRKINIKKFFNE